MADLVLHTGTDRTQWLGSSDIAPIMGISPWATPLDVYFAKIGMPRPPDPERMRLFRRGKHLEPAILNMFEEEIGISLIARGLRYRSKSHPWMAAEIDAEYSDSTSRIRNVEAKSVHPHAARGFGEPETDQLPVYYLSQAQWGMMITGREHCTFAALIGSDLHIYNVERDDETIAGLLEHALKFWNDHVLARVPPPPKTLHDVVRLLPPDKDIIAEAPLSIVELIRQFEEAKERSRNDDTLAEQLKFKIGEWLLGAEKMEIPSPEPKHIIVSAGRPIQRISYQEQSRIDADLVRTKYPDIAAECSKLSKFYRFDKPKRKRA
jgi:putative phage-type endonuclease